MLCLANGEITNEEKYKSKICSACYHKSCTNRATPRHDLGFYTDNKSDNIPIISDQDIYIEVEDKMMESATWLSSIMNIVSEVRLSQTQSADKNDWILYIIIRWKLNCLEGKIMAKRILGLAMKAVNL